MPRRSWAPTLHIGHSGAILLAFGTIWLLTGLGLAIAGDAPIISTLWPIVWMPIWLRSGLWLGAGAVAIAYALRPRWVTHDGLAWGLLYLPPAIRVLAYIIGWIDSLVPDAGGPGYDRGWLSALIYAAMCAAVMICSKWPDPGRADTKECA